jgi:hypothetical protein
MTDEERQRFARRLRERDAEIERLHRDWAVACKGLGEVRAEVARLTAALELAADGLEEGGYTIEAANARRALEPDRHVTR